VKESRILSGRHSSIRILWLWPGRIEDSFAAKTVAESPGIDLSVVSTRRAELWSQEDLGPARLVLAGLGSTSRGSGLLHHLWRISNQWVQLLDYWREVRKFRPKLVHIWFDERPLGLLRMIRLRLSFKIIVHLHDVKSHKQTERKWYVYVYNWMRLALANSVTVFSVHLKEQATSRYPLVGQKIVVLPMFPAKPVESPVTTFAEQEIRPRESTMRILAFGSIRENKGYHLLFEAFEKVGADNLELIVAGRNQLEDNSGLIERMSRNPKVFLEIGDISLQRKAELFLGAALVALPYTDFHGESAVLRDAINFKRPVIVSEIPQFAWLTNAPIAITFPDGDIDKLASVLRSVSEHPDVLADMHVEFTSVNVYPAARDWAEQIVSFYRGLLGIPDP
jgi:glycosyltransferase involved in cell wall biosynthesis